jgi:hypothetical protein
MSLDKAIKHKKEYRKAYRGAKAVDSWCRNHGGCSWCTDNRLYQYNKQQEYIKSRLDELASSDYGDDELNDWKSIRMAKELKGIIG